MSRKLVSRAAQNPSCSDSFIISEEFIHVWHRSAVYMRHMYMYLNQLAVPVRCSGISLLIHKSVTR